MNSVKQKDEYSNFEMQPREEQTKSNSVSINFVIMQLKYSIRNTNFEIRNENWTFQMYVIAIYKCWT